MRDHRGLLSRAEGCWTFDARDPDAPIVTPFLFMRSPPPPKMHHCDAHPPARAGSFIGSSGRSRRGYEPLESTLCGGSV